MTAFGNVTVHDVSRFEPYERLSFSTTGPSAYETGGSVIDLSSATLPKTARGVTGFRTRCDGLAPGGISPGASAQYIATYIPAAAGDPATGRIKVRDLTAAADAEVANGTDLSALTFQFLAFGQ